MNWIVCFFMFWGSFVVSSAHSMELYGHRGAAIVAPENTLNAIEEAFRRGYAGVELDIQLTRDGMMILLHDCTLERTARFNGQLSREVFRRMVTVPVRALNYEEVKLIDVGRWHAPAYVPTLKDALRILPPGKKCFIEIKGSAREILKPLDDLLKELSVDPHYVTIISFDLEILKEVQALLPQYSVVLNTSHSLTNTPGKMRREMDKVLLSNVDGINFEGADNVTQEIVDELHAQQKLVCVWEPGLKAVDVFKMAHRMQSCGVDIFITNLLEKSEPEMRNTGL